MTETVCLDDLLSVEQYSIPDEVKDRTMIELVRRSLPRVLTNAHIQAMFVKLGIRPDHLARMEDLPTLPVQMFKHFDLSMGGNISRILKSSGTTSNVPSRVPLSKRTSMNQTKALSSILQHFLGSKRRTFLVIDHPGVNDPREEITARGAGVRGLSIFSKRTIFLLKEEEGRLVLNLEALEEVRSLGENDIPYVFGFTYIIWTIFFKQMMATGQTLDIGNAIMFHSGGWKNMSSEKVSSQEFNLGLSKVMGVPLSNIHDFYGMAEQTGAIFVECEHGHKHVPNFAQVIVRDFNTQRPCVVGERGMIEVCSVLADSYYSHAILTEDVGMLTGVDDCPCGRLGRHFIVLGRVERAEVRGCGDTFREGKE